MQEQNASFLNPFHRKVWGAERLLFFRLQQNSGQDRGLARAPRPASFSRLSVAFCGVSPIPIEATGRWLP